MKLIITVGVPGSGKTTWAKETAKEMGNCILISRDDIRYNMGLGGKFTREKEDLVTKIQKNIVEFSLAQGKNVIIHNTHLRQSDHDEWASVASQYSATFHVHYFNVNVVELLRRNFVRGEHAVPVSRIWAMYEQYKKLTGWIPASDKLDESLPKAVIFDVDGTLTKIGQRSPYDFTKVIDDPCNPPVVQLFKMYKEAGFACLVSTGREGTEQCRADTLTSLSNYGVDFDDFYQRLEGDSRPDIEVKEEILHTQIIKKYRPVLAVDDRDQVVGMYRMNGITCLQVDYGNF